MNETVKTRWLTALRSGEYKQTIGQLRFDNQFCCLGVLCDVVDPNAWEGDNHGDEVTFPSNQILAVCGLPGTDTNEGNELLDTLITMNDSEGIDFNQIADWIEENL